MISLLLLFSLEDGLLLKALMGLANAQPQLLALPWEIATDDDFPFTWSSAEDETQYEDDDDDEEDDVIMNPLNMPAHFTLSFMHWWWLWWWSPPRITAEAATALGLPSRWDSTLRRVQSPNPVEILSKKSPEKLLLPHPTDLDLETLRSKDETEAVVWLLGLSSSSTAMSIFLPKLEPKHLSFCFPQLDPVLAALIVEIVGLLLRSLKLLVEAEDLEEEW